MILLHSQKMLDPLMSVVKKQGIAVSQNQYLNALSLPTNEGLVLKKPDN